MEKEFCTVQTGDKVKCYERGIAYKKIAEEFQVMRLIVEVSVLCLSKQFMMSEDMTRSAM